jgi:hypothetical protein
MKVRLLSVTNNPQLDVDWIFVAPYITSEPTHGSWTAEEQYGWILSITSIPVSGIEFTVAIDEGEPTVYTTPNDVAIPDGSDVELIVTESEPFSSGGHKYWWEKWDDEETSKTRNFTVTEDMAFEMSWYQGKTRGRCSNLRLVQDSTKSGC